MSSGWNFTGGGRPPTTGVAGCDECNRGSNPKPWPIFTVNLSNGQEVCAKCLTPMTFPRKEKHG